MIILLLNEANFEYDIQGLIRSFFPKKNLETHYLPGTEPVDSAPKKHYEEEAELRLEVYYQREQEEISIMLYELSNQDEKAVSMVTFEADMADRGDTKNRLKRAVYQILSSYTKKTLPWGTLTGIRPSKIVLRLIEEGRSEEEIRSYMMETYLISDEKMDLSYQVAGTEYDLLKPIHYEEGYSLYIGIPFCPTTCLYCSFPSYAIASFKGQVDRYLDALEQELQFVGENLVDKTLDTIYVGGGTPTSLSATQLDRLFTMIEKYLDLSHLLEYTVEAGRPDSITKDKLLTMKSHHVSRISINPQTMKQETLNLIGRHHTIEELHTAYDLARQIGFSSINMDLILGLPGEDVNDVRHTLQEVAKMKPDNLTVHSLAIKRSSRLNIEWDSYRDYVMENSDVHMNLAYETAKALGLKPYYLYRQKNMAGNLENVGFASPGLEGLYNVLIMEEKQTIMALGAGSACKFVTDGGRTVTRCENVKDVDTYIDRIQEMIQRKREKLEEIGWL